MHFCTRFELSLFKVFNTNTQPHVNSFSKGAFHFVFFFSDIYIYLSLLKWLSKGQGPF